MLNETIKLYLLPFKYMARNSQWLLSLFLLFSLALLLATSAFAQLQEIKVNSASAFGNISIVDHHSDVDDNCRGSDQHGSASQNITDFAFELQQKLIFKDYSRFGVSSWWLKTDSVQSACGMILDPTCKGYYKIEGFFRGYEDTVGGTKLFIKPKALDCGYTTELSQETDNPFFLLYNEEAFGHGRFFWDAWQRERYSGKNCKDTKEGRNFSRFCFDSKTEYTSKEGCNGAGCEIARFTNRYELKSIRGESITFNCGGTNVIPEIQQFVMGSSYMLGSVQCLRDGGGTCGNPSYWWLDTTSENWVGQFTHTLNNGCDDKQKCTADSCDAYYGCVHVPIDGCDKDSYSECKDNSCVLVTGSGEDKCRGNQDCGTHSICESNACKIVSGDGASQCADDNDCQGTHTVCQNQACVTIPGPGANECGSNLDCQATHSVCENNSCKIVQGRGTSECATDTDCDDCADNEYLTCESDACVPKTGCGVSSCASNNDCTSHSECKDNACVSVPGSEEDACSADADCAKESHLECAGNACQQVSGPGADRCQGFWDCQRETHYACVSNSCSLVQGPGNDSCQNDWKCRDYYTTCESNDCVLKYGKGENTCGEDKDCCPNGNCEYHSECNKNNLCVQVLGAGQSKCRADVECRPEQQYTKCQSNACVLVDGPGTNQCVLGERCWNDTKRGHMKCNKNNAACEWDPTDGVDECLNDNDCSPDGEHSVCEGNACVTVPGKGRNECSPNSGCVPFHLECENFACVRVPGKGEDQCLNDFPCNVHTECDNEAKQCIAVPGPGINQCSGDSGCDGKHLACNAEKTCVLVDDEGIDQCSTGNPFDCKNEKEAYLDCIGQACVPVEGKEEDACNNNFDCSQQPSCSLSVDPDSVKQKKDTTNVKLELFLVDSQKTSITVSCGDGAINAELSRTEKTSTTETFKGICGVYSQAGEFLVGENLVIQNTLCAPAPIEVFESGGTGSRISLDAVRVNPPSVPEKTSLKSVVLVVENRGTECANTIASISFSKPSGESVLKTLNRSGFPLQTGSSEIKFDSQNGLNTASLPVGVYGIKGVVECVTDKESDRKTVFFTVTQGEFAEIPETETFMVVALAFVLTGILFAGRSWNRFES